MQDIPKYTYMIAEDEKLIRKKLIKKIDALHLPFELAGEAANGQEAIALIEQHCPQLVLTDVRMPLCDGLEVVKYLYHNHPDTKAIILSGYEDFHYAQTAIQYSVEDYLLKPIAPETLSESLQKILLKIGSESERLQIYHSKSNALSPEALSQLMQNYLLENYQQDISFQELGEKFGFTPEYLGKLFKKYTGETPSKYLTKLRMNKAKLLLLNEPGLEIQKIGELAGYKDGFYFSRVFKSHTGMQPGEFRRRNRKDWCAVKSPEQKR